jgi:energy-coupling factor transport system substrate-specific component
LVAAVALVDYATARLADGFGLPFYLDSWGTMTGSFVGGPLVGAAGGALYNLALAATVEGAAASVWAVISVTIALLAWLFWRDGWLDIERPMRLLGAGAATGVVSALLGAIIDTVLWGGPPPYDKSLLFRKILETSDGGTRAALFLDRLLVELADKTVSIIVAVAVATLVLERRRWKRRAPTVP